jgi:hypothetical protein
MGRIKADSILGCWHGEVLIDDYSARTIALRLRLARPCPNAEAECKTFGLDRLRQILLEPKRLPADNRRLVASERGLVKSSYFSSLALPNFANAHIDCHRQFR